MKKFSKCQGCFDQSCLLSWLSAWNLAFPAFIAPIVCYLCEILHDQYEYFKELHKEQGYNWPTTYRAGAAVVSTFTSLEALVMHATIQAIWPASCRLTCASSGKEFEENFGSGSLHARGLPRTPTSEPALRLQAINLQLVFPSQLRSS